MHPHRAFATLALLSLALLCSAVEPRKNAANYPAHADTPKLSLGVEYLVHSVPTGHETFFLLGVLVVDTAIYPKDGEIPIDSHSFTLRINDKTVVAAMAPQMAAYSLGFSGGFPGAPNNRPAPVPQAPDPNHPDGPAPGPEAPADAMVRLALPEGRFHSPQSGFLYFPFSGKTKNIRSLELIYNGAAGEVTVPLF